MNRLTISSPAFRQLLSGLSADSRRFAICPAGLSRLPDRIELLLHAVSSTPGTLVQTGPAIAICAAEGQDRVIDALENGLSRIGARTGAAIALGLGAGAGLIAGLYTSGRTIEPLHQFAIVEAGMPLVPLHPSGLAPPPPGPADLATWSRTIGALGESCWQRLTSLHYAVAGCGRTGSLVATSLERLGVRTITMIDPDTLELHNFGEMDGVRLSDAGRYKSQALADFLCRQTNVPDHSFRGLPESVFSLPALAAIKAADLIFCCVDSAEARIATSFLANLYLKPVIDIGTGILPDPNSAAGTRMGADVRLTHPGRCLLCLGGITGFDQAKAALRNRIRRGLPAAEPGDWRGQRAGSLRSLNQAAAGFAVRLLEEYLCGRRRESAWLQIDIDDSGMPRLIRPDPPPGPQCPICRVAGLGDAAVDQIDQVCA